MKAITIIGGGLAGLALGIALRRRDVPVLIREAGCYPRHKVCGEFISGRGQATFEKLGLSHILQRVEAIQAHTAAFVLPHWSSGPRKIPVPAICLSRHKLDETLAKEFRGLGGMLTENDRCRDELNCESVVRATGRRLKVEENGWHWLGLKAHATGVSLEADLEMHLVKNGYVGICRLANDMVNVCGLFRTKAGNPTRLAPIDILRGEEKSRLRARVGTACFDRSSFCSVAGLQLRPLLAGNEKEFCIGDALTMVPPVTGNGMSMAFEAAEMAVRPLLEYTAGTLAWTEARNQYRQRYFTAFKSRLFWAQGLQRLMFGKAPQQWLGKFLATSNLAWNTIFAHTR
jgi:flavin-dependent dehydrogenase